MHTKQIVGLVAGAICVIVGVYLLISGFHHKEGTVQKIKHKVTGNHSSTTRNYMISGIVFLVVGCGLVVFSRSGKKEH